MDFFFHRGIRNKNLGKVKNFQVWVAKDLLRKGQKTTGGGAYSAPPPSWLKGLRLKNMYCSYHSIKQNRCMLCTLKSHWILPPISAIELQSIYVCALYLCIASSKFAIFAPIYLAKCSIIRGQSIIKQEEESFFITKDLALKQNCFH